MKKTYKNKTGPNDFSLLAHIAPEVWDLDLETKHTHKFAAKWTTKISPPFSHEKPKQLTISSPYTLVICVNGYCVNTYMIACIG